MAKLPKRGNGAEHFFSTRARSWGKLFRPNCRFAGHSTVPFFRKGANMTPRRARERTAWGAHVITYGLFFKSVFWVSCKSADQTKKRSSSKWEELVDNKPNPELSKKTESATLGRVSAFCSHSWSDGGGAKYQRLQEYSANRESCHIWLE